MNELKEFLCHPHVSTYTPEAIEKFNSISMIFIAGEPNIKAWEPKSSQLLVLLSLMIKTNKPSFIVGFGMGCFVYTLSTEAVWGKRREVGVLNKSGNPLKYAETMEIDDTTKVKDRDWVIDSTTGDIYVYSGLNKSFSNVSNSGLHLRKNLRTRVSLKTINLIQFSDRLYPKESILCTVVDKYKSHWLFDRFRDYEFGVTRRNKWDIHRIEPNVPATHFHVLANSNSAPLIIEHRNIICIQFQIEKSNLTTIKLVYTFIEHYLNPKRTSITLNTNTFKKYSQSLPKALPVLRRSIPVTKKLYEGTKSFNFVVTTMQCYKSDDESSIAPLPKSLAKPRPKIRIVNPKAYSSFYNLSHTPFQRKSLYNSPEPNFIRRRDFSPAKSQNEAITPNSPLKRPKCTFSQVAERFRTTISPVLPNQFKLQ